MLYGLDNTIVADIQDRLPTNLTRSGKGKVAWNSFPPGSVEVLLRCKLPSRLSKAS
jgi:hypothetical protein